MNEGKSHLIALPLSSFVLMPYLSHHHVLTEEQVGQGMEEEEKGNEERGV